MPPALNIGLLLFPELTQLDLTTPAEIFGSVPAAAVHLVAKTADPVRTGLGWRIIPTTSFAECPDLQVLCVPGGSGDVAVMEDGETLAFLRRQAAGARYVTSVCTGSLILGAAGLLTGYRATSHWMSRDLLKLFGAIPVDERVVYDRNRITGGGMTASIDFGLAVVALLWGDEAARGVQLRLEYDPEPPFACGTPELAGPDLVERVTAAAADRQARRHAAATRAAAALARSPSPTSVGEGGAQREALGG
jgi:cyclohexyl-isocyanide hydratase